MRVTMKFMLALTMSFCCLSAVSGFVLQTAQQPVLFSGPSPRSSPLTLSMADGKTRGKVKSRLKTAGKVAGGIGAVAVSSLVPGLDTFVAGGLLTLGVKSIIEEKKSAKLKDAMTTDSSNTPGTDESEGN